MNSIQGLKIQNLSEVSPYVLVVDDEVFNLEIIKEELEDEGYLTDTVENGTQALEMLKQYPDRYQAVLLDRMMPDMDGIEVLHYMKKDEKLQGIPVIMQTAKATQADVKDGLDAGVLYYLTKPFEKKDLLAIVDTAVSCYFNYEYIRKAVDAKAAISPKPGQFEVRTVDEAYNLASLLASACPEPKTAVLGLVELLMNGIEHGNLNLGFQRKGELQAEGRWREEIDRLLELPENKDKRVRVTFQISEHELRFLIKDDGKGFNVKQYENITPERLTMTHGRGITIAKKMSFDYLEYLGDGNEVLAIIKNASQ